MDKHNLLNDQYQCHPECHAPSVVYRRVNEFWKLSIILFFICSGCTNYDGLNYAVKASDRFVENYADEFLENKKLLLYTYNPRIQFFHDGNDSDDYMAFVRPNGFFLMCHTNCCLIDEKFGKTNPVHLDKGDYFFKEDTILSITQNDTTKSYHPDFKEGSHLIFKNLKELLDRYGIMAFYQSSDKEYVRAYLTTQYYLLYMGDFSKMNIYGFDKDFIVKEYDKGWLLLKAKRPLDLG